MKHLFLGLFIVVSLLGTSSIISAEDTDGVARVWHFVAEDGMNEELEAALKAYHARWMDAEGRFSWTYFTPISGTEIGHYFGRTANHNWSDFDATHDWDQAAGDDFQASVAPFIKSFESTWSTMNFEASKPPAEDFDAKYVEVSVWNVNPGMRTAFDAGLNTIAGTLRDAGWGGPWIVTNSRFGGMGNEVHLVSIYDSFADIQDTSPTFYEKLVEILGADETAKLVSDWVTTFTNGDTQLFAVRPDLSY